MSVASRKAAKEKAKVVINEEIKQENEQVKLAFNSTIQIEYKDVCTIDGKKVLHLLKMHGLGALEHPVTSLVTMIEYLMLKL